MNDLGFKPTVDACEANYPNKKDFSNFREDADTYHILLSNKDADENSLELAREINTTLVDHYLSVPKPKLGYGDNPEIPFREVDFCDSHHIMMSTIIADFKKDWGRIIEIGAGYGNMIRLNEAVLDYQEWVDIDRPFVSELAQWYLNETLGIRTRNKLSFVSAYDYPEMESDLVIGAHSISELAMDDFMAYYEKIIKNTKYFFYATHINNCGEELLKSKLEIISKDFTLVKQVISEGGGVQNNLYSRNLL